MSNHGWLRVQKERETKKLFEEMTVKPTIPRSSINLKNAHTHTHTHANLYK